MTEPHDLRDFFQAVGRGFSGERALVGGTALRTEPEVPAELLDDDNAAVGGQALEVSAFVDGIQASMIVTYRAHRPVYLSYVAAGAVGPGAVLLSVREKLSVVCSRADLQWVEALDQKLPIDVIEETTAFEVERRALETLGGDRETLERSLVEDLVSVGSGYLCLDGSLVGRPKVPELVGVVKSVRKKYLADESFLLRLPAGWRSPRFKIPAGVGGMERYSCYLRLQDASDRSWTHGLIRLEAFEPELLDPLAVMALGERQSRASGDARWDRHLAGVAACEKALRARRPVVFRL